MGISSQGGNHHGTLPSESTDLKHDLATVPRIRGENEHTQSFGQGESEA